MAAREGCPESTGTTSKISNRLDNVHYDGGALMKMALVLVVAGAVLAACTSGGNEPPPSTPTTQSSRTERPKVAPPIDRELDISAYQAKPCALLRDEQLSVLGLPVKGEPAGRGICKWHVADADLGYVSYVTGNPLQDMYNVLQGTTYDVFRPTTVVGQPAVVYASFQGSQVCNISIGIAHDQGIDITISGTRPHTDWCAMSVTAATDIVHNLGG